MSVLDADMGEVGRWIGEGWRWWTGELAAMVPARWRRRKLRGPIALIDAAGGVTVTRGGRPVVVPAGTPVIAAVPERQVLVRTLSLPPLGDEDLRRLVTLQLDRLMPFPPGSALTDIVPGPVTDGARTATVAALPVAQAVEAEAAVRGAGLTPIKLGARRADGGVAYDFLPALRAARGERDPRAGRRAWWRLVAALFALNILLLIAADMLALRNVERLVGSHAQAADGVRRARRRVLDEEVARHAMLARRVARDPLAIVADISRKMPPGASVRRLAIAPEGIRVAGVRRADVDVLGAMRAGGRYRQVRNATAEVLAATPEGQPFDIGLDWPSRR
ncbi:hypothetical protein [Sphingomonas sp.]|uniref:hypothetical protein n=1 Tax=Sphingomonas sp. TaxID=28214 RepID=UPI003B000FE8